MAIYFGLENSANWGFDWFGTLAEAEAAMKSRPALYGTNDEPVAMSADDIYAQNL